MFTISVKKTIYRQSFDFRFEKLLSLDSVTTRSHIKFTYSYTRMMFFGFPWQILLDLLKHVLYKNAFTFFLDVLYALLIIILQLGSHWCKIIGHIFENEPHFGAADTHSICELNCPSNAVFDGKLGYPCLASYTFYPFMWKSFLWKAVDISWDSNPTLLNGNHIFVCGHSQFFATLCIVLLTFSYIEPPLSHLFPHLLSVDFLTVSSIVLGKLLISYR